MPVPTRSMPWWPNSGGPGNEPLRIARPRPARRGAVPRARRSSTPPAPVTTSCAPASSAPGARPSTTASFCSSCWRDRTPPPKPRKLASILLDTFGSPARVLAARTDTLRTVAGLGEAGIAAVKTAEALGIAMARAALPETFHPQLATYDKVVEYCRALAAHRDVEEFRALYLDTKNRLASATSCCKPARSTTPRSIPDRSASARWRWAPPPWSFLHQHP